MSENNTENTLTTARLLLEPLVPAHAALLYPALRDSRLYVFIPQDPPSSEQALRGRYVRLATRRSPDGTQVWLNWALRRHEAGDYAGTVQATVYSDGTAALAYMVFPSFWRQGYAREGCARVLAHLEAALGVHRVAAEIDTRNVASIRLVKSLGFRRVAVTPNADYFKGASSDEYRYELAVPTPESR